METDSMVLEADPKAPPTREAVLTVIHAVAGPRPPSEYNSSLCKIVDQLGSAHGKYFNSDRNTAINILGRRLAENGSLTPEDYLFALERGVEEKLRSRDEQKSPHTRTAGLFMVESRQVVNMEFAQRPAAEKWAGFANGIEIRPGEATWKEEEEFIVHPALEASMKIGRTIRWAPSRQSWDRQLRHFVVNYCSVDAKCPPGEIIGVGQPILTWLCAHSAYAELVGDEVLNKGYRTGRLLTTGPIFREPFLTFVDEVLTTMREESYCDRVVMTRWEKAHSLAVLTLQLHDDMRELLHVHLCDMSPEAAPMEVDEDPEKESDGEEEPEATLGRRIALLLEMDGDLCLLLGKWRIAEPNPLPTPNTYRDMRQQMDAFLMEGPSEQLMDTD